MKASNNFFKYSTIVCVSALTFLFCFSYQQMESTEKMERLVVGFSLLTMFYFYYRLKINRSRQMEEKKLSELDREKLISELTTKNNALAYFTYELSHTLRRPAANIIGLIQILKAMKTETPEEKQLIDHMEQSAVLLDKRMKNLNSTLKLTEKNIPICSTKRMNSESMGSD